MLPEDIINLYNKGYSVKKITQILQRQTYSRELNKNLYKSKDIQNFVEEIIMKYKF